MELSNYMKAEAKEFHATCKWCGSLLEIVSLDEIGVESEHDALIKCTNPMCAFVDYWIADPNSEAYFEKTGKLPGTGRKNY